MSITNFDPEKGTFELRYPETMTAFERRNMESRELIYLWIGFWQAIPAGTATTDERALFTQSMKFVLYPDEQPA